MLKNCCCCVSLAHGSLLTGAIRLVHWILLLIGTIYIAVSVFSPDSGYMPIMTKVYIETNSYILFLILLVSLLGIGAESILLHGLIKKKFDNLRYWYIMTVLCFLLSIVLAGNFILGLLEIPYRPEMGHTWIQDAFCTLFYTEYFFIPDYLIGPRLTPVLTACIILVHLFLPVFHAYSFMVIRAAVRSARYQAYVEAAQVAQAPPLDAGAAAVGVNGTTLPRKNLCAKCALREEENGIYRCDSQMQQQQLHPHHQTPLNNKPFETTC